MTPGRIRHIEAAFAKFALSFRRALSELKKKPKGGGSDLAKELTRLLKKVGVKGVAVSETDVRGAKAPKRKRDGSVGAAREARITMVRDACVRALKDKPGGLLANEMLAKMVRNGFDPKVAWPNTTPDRYSRVLGASLSTDITDTFRSVSEKAPRRGNPVNRWSLKTAKAAKATRTTKKKPRHRITQVAAIRAAAKAVLTDRPGLTSEELLAGMVQRGFDPSSAWRSDSTRALASTIASDPAFHATAVARPTGAGGGTMSVWRLAAEEPGRKEEPQLETQE